MQNSDVKRTKPPWKRFRQWRFISVLLVSIGILLFTLYNSRTESFTLLRSSFVSSKPLTSEATPALPQVPTGEHPSSPYTVPYPHPYHFTLDQPSRCRQESPFLVLMVPVAPSNREARDVIRSTWGTETTVMGQAVNHYFVLGQPRDGENVEQLQKQVLEESQTHGDILQSSFLDSYKNLTIKTMVMFEWLTSHCPNTSYAMKVDSDIFLNVRNLVDMLLKSPRQLYMTGVVVRDAAVMRNVDSKWFLPVSEFPEPSYPTYAMGLGYVFSMDLPQKIVEASSHVKAVYIEDVYVGLCLRYLGIQVSDPPTGGFGTFKPEVTDNCYWTKVITTMLWDSNELKNTWTAYETQTRQCL
ncbi:beta-1,3-galactosyltransferase 1-like [Betta splendens]|uniref:Hexosyltransferase n=1 Tax=Betta splendens TaxID=158456 RepID=A0A6P7NVZ2_BETSP|nr:beta-1,3-galactosyltransferase 1-like [Betta splendens]